MQVRVKVFATLRRHLPEARARNPFVLEVPEGASVAEVIRELDLPPGEVKTVFVNGRVQPLAYVLRGGDDLGVFPPIAGGCAHPAQLR